MYCFAGTYWNSTFLYDDFVSIQRLCQFASNTFNVRQIRVAIWRRWCTNTDKDYVTEAQRRADIGGKCKSTSPMAFQQLGKQLFVDGSIACNKLFYLRWIVINSNYLMT